MSERPLQGLRILVTRPAHQAAPLCDLIRTAGGEPVVLPVLAIADPRDPAAAQAVAARLGEFDFAIFISANAAERGLALLRSGGGLPPYVKVAAVGQRTGLSLVEHGGRADITAPPPYNSEALLTRQEFQALAGKRIAIFRGEGGRERLAETLRQRGADVTYAEVYRRVPPPVDLAKIVEGAGEVHIIVVTSQDGLRNLAAMAEAAGRRDWLLDRRLAVISPRVAQLAAEIGFRHPPLIAEQAGDSGLVDAIATWRRGAQAAQ